ncbi:uncharacterized protein LOC117645857 [Thrips palmi]|uniref:Uncharacterized protein LOC117645857 n=1 Tax=Thrips palmi TaxID=161013 RepID=A0A6P8ZNF3_THRPL|nr:uncharacterized protein LOC117645857 [Thrips palmi]
MVHLFVHARDFGCVDSIKNDHLSLLADRIIDRFTCEKKSTYYIPPSGRSVATGKLSHKLRNLRRKPANSQSKESISEESVDDPAERLRCAPKDPNVDLEAAINFLAFTRSPWTEVEEKWVSTHQYRLNQLKTEPYLDKYFASWPVLQSPSGCTLLEADFNSLWPGRNSVIFSKWPLFEEKLLKLAEKDVKDQTSKAILSLLKPNTSSDGRTAIAFSILPALCPPTRKIKLNNGKLWLPSIAEARSSMILHAQNANKVRLTLKENTDRLFKQGQRVQPLIIVVGPTLDKITKSYVCIDKTLWATSCVMKSIDVCFKAVFATESEYPGQSQHFWEAIQKSIYKMKTVHDKCQTPLDNIFKSHCE